MARKAVIHVFRCRDGKWRSHKYNVNGKVTCPSQGYHNSSNARRAARREHPGLELVTVPQKG